MNSPDDKDAQIRFYIETLREEMAAEDFQRDFFESLCDQFEEKDFLSDKQVACLSRMYERVTS